MKYVISVDIGALTPERESVKVLRGGGGLYLHRVADKPLSPAEARALAAALTEMADEVAKGE